MKEQIKQLWQLMKKSYFPKWLIGVLFLLGLVDTVVGLAIPLLTMDLINDFSLEGFAWGTLAIVVTALVIQAINVAGTRYTEICIKSRINNILFSMCPDFDLGTLI